MNPFKKGSLRYKDFEKMSDLKWHCTKCELSAAQAKTWQYWYREKGIQFEKDENGKNFKRIYCQNCEAITVHRKLISTEILESEIIKRSLIPLKIIKRAKDIYNMVDEYSVRSEKPRDLEIECEQSLWVIIFIKTKTAHSAVL